jgi:hypothetical protein
MLQVNVLQFLILEYYSFSYPINLRKLYYLNSIFNLIILFYIYNIIFNRTDKL